MGECVEQIGDTKLHPPTKRDWFGSHGRRKDFWGHNNEFSSYDANVLAELNMTGKGPLWLPHDFRREAWMGQAVTKKDEWKSPTGYHFHNFFMSGEEIRFKYATYGHANSKARKNSLRHIHDGGDLEGDLEMAVMCAFGNHTKKTERNFESIGGTSRPIYYLNEEARRARHNLWQDIVRKDEEKQTQNNLANTEATVQNKNYTPQPKSSSYWDSSKSAVLGLASGYGREVYETFVGSLRATGFSGHIILAVSKDAGADVITYLSEQNVTTKFVERAEKCTFNGTIGEKGVPIDMHKSTEWKCPKEYPDYKITWARFLYYRDWLKDCPTCTDGVILTDVRDAFFQVSL